MPLYLVATPIGHLADCSPHARDVLASAAVIAAEDTRNTRKLLTALGITAPPLVALHAHNEEKIAEQVATRALEESVILVSDAGTPGISDPGARLVSMAHRLGVKIRSVPGPSALAAALAASGFAAAPSTFLGFPPRKGRDRWAREALERSETLVVYEAKGRVQDLIDRLGALQPEREAVLCRELSKRFEEVRRAPLSQLQVGEGRGEFVVVVGPGEALAPASAIEADARSLKSVAAVLAERWGVSKKDAYNRLLALEREL